MKSYCNRHSGASPWRPPLREGKPRTGRDPERHSGRSLAGIQNIFGGDEEKGQRVPKEKSEVTRKKVWVIKKEAGHGEQILQALSAKRQREHRKEMEP